MATVEPNSKRPVAADLAAPAKSPVDALLTTRLKSSTPRRLLAATEPAFLRPLVMLSNKPT